MAEKKEQRFWVVVASKDHIQMGVDGGFVQSNHGKSTSLKRMKSGDGLVVYSPGQTYGKGNGLKSFTAIGKVKDEELYQVIMTEDFKPYRRNIQYYPSHDVAVQPLVENLDFIRNKKSWGYAFRFGFLEIPREDFELIEKEMTSNL